MESRTLAVAGMFQCADLISELARHGRCDEQAYLAVIKSVFSNDADNVAKVYEDVNNLRYGAQVCVDIAKQRKANYQNLMIYVMGMIQLEKQMRARKDFMPKIDEGLTLSTRQVELYGYEHDSVSGSLSNLYQSTFSTLSHRIQVVGDVNWLTQDRVASRIRALLFAGIRATMLWRNLNGRRYQLLFQRGKITRQFEAWLATEH
ncbi:high frequency lysogenization protein HflD [uncultured Umboniibacter sp.]|uniref:high frequency lysogenization protein HflD n=1 Tax=uncultured Umboniibacter sp. TaxID=1798917 RepID=UPI002620DCCA|nr:high frequency lysogenization protein HflD [uncultured Umboniibacter sp.]